MLYLRRPVGTAVNVAIGDGHLVAGLVAEDNVLTANVSGLGIAN